MFTLWRASIGLMILLIVLALALWAPGQNWSYLKRGRTNREIIIWTIFMLVVVILIIGSALMRL